MKVGILSGSSSGSEIEKKTGFKVMFRRWMRALRHLYYTKILRQAGEPSYIARGVALGLLVGWVIPMGFQIVIVLPLAFVFRAAKIPAIVFTFVSNHFTVFFLYPLQCWLGSLVLRGGLTYDSLADMMKKIIAALEKASMREAWEQFSTLGMQVITAFFAGGLLLGVPSAVLGYFVTLCLVRRYRRFKAERRNRKKYGKASAARTKPNNDSERNES